MANVKLTFEGLITSTAYTAYCNYFDGYQGFNFKDMYLITEHAITVFGYQNTGFQSVMHGTTDAFFSAYRNTWNGYGKGYILSPTRETFNLKTGFFASVWDTSQRVTFTGYDGTHERGLVTITLSQAASKINFANYGNDFRHITELKEFTNSAIGGSFGKGWQVAFDNLRAHWNGAVPGSAHGVHAVAAHLVGVGSHGSAHAGSHSAADHGGSAARDGSYHSVLTALAGDHGAAGLTAEFQLPHMEDFGAA